MKQVLEKTIELIQLDENNIEHLKFLKEIYEDNEISRLSPLWKGDRFLVSLGDEFIGLYSYDKTYYYEKATSLSYCIIENYRNQGYGVQSLGKMIDLLFKNKEISEIILEIDYNNIPSIKLAEKVGFEQDYNLYEKFIEEGYKYVPLSLSKEKYYQRKGRKL